MFGGGGVVGDRGFFFFQKTVSFSAGEGFERLLLQDSAHLQQEQGGRQGTELLRGHEVSVLPVGKET